jgi:hypothetical protein
MNLKFLTKKKIVESMAKVTLIAVALCSSLFAFGQTEGEDNGFVVDKIIAKVDNYIVIKSELERGYQDYLTNGGSPSQEAKCQYLAMLVRNKLMLAKAEIDSVMVLDGEVEPSMERPWSR